MKTAPTSTQAEAWARRHLIFERAQPRYSARIETSPPCYGFRAWLAQLWRKTCK